MLEKLTTETRNPNTMNLDEYSVMEIIETMNNEDLNVIAAVKNELPSIAKVIEQTVECIRKGGRLIYVGAGTSGRIGMLDAVECPPTFGMDPSRVVGVLAGGENQMFAKEEAEDSYELGQKKMEELNVNENDIIVGLAASGRTPYVIGALDYANDHKAVTASVACNKGAVISSHATYPVELNNGPEVLTGSTRLKAGTSQKMVCNMISTASMIRLGKVYQNMMVDVDVSNEKLLFRWQNIVMTATGCDQAEAEKVYELSGRNAKTAICMILMGYTKEEAEQALIQANGFVKDVVNRK